MGRNLFALLAAMLIAAPAAAQHAETAAQRDARMQWWREARFGLFIHWGVYAVAAGEWEGRRVPGVGEWIMENGRIPASRYVTLAEKFAPTGYDPAAWAALAREAGCRYMVITSRHHDGFCLWDTRQGDWDVTRTPLKRDLLRPLKDACDREGVRFGLYYSILDWTHPHYTPRRAWNDLPAPEGGPRFETFVSYVHAQVEEIISNYDPAVLWFDGEWESTWTTEHGVALESLVRKLKPSIIVNNRVGKAREGMAGLSRPGERAAGDFGTPEQEVPGRGLPGVDWETCMTMNDTWGFVRADTNWKSSTTLVRTLVDVASKGGNFLLNVGPTAEGEIPRASVDRLRDMGAWLKVHGESIYGTRAGPFNKLSWGRCTQRASPNGATLYLHVFDWPADGRLELTGLENTIRRARVLGTDGAVEIDSQGPWPVLRVSGSPTNPHATVVVADCVGTPKIAAVRFKPDAEGVFALHARDAEVSGHAARYESGPDRDCIGFWTDARDSVYWPVEAPARAAARYTVEITYACDPSTPGATFAVEAGEGPRSRVQAVVQDTGGWGNFVAASIGTIVWPRGADRVTVRVVSKPGNAVMNLRSVRLVPVRDDKEIR